MPKKVITGWEPWHINLSKEFIDEYRYDDEDNPNILKKEIIKLKERIAELELKCNNQDNINKKCND